MKRQRLSRSLCPVFALWAVVAATQSAPAQQPGGIQHWEGHQGAIYAVAWASDGSAVASGGADRTLRVWDAQSGRLTRTVGSFERPILSVAFSPDGHLVAAGDAGGKLRWFDTPLIRPTGDLGSLGNVPRAMAAAPDGSWLVAGDAGGGVKLWQGEKLEAVRDLAGASGEITAVAVLPEARLVLAAVADGSLYAWKAEDGTALGRRILPRTGALAAVAEGWVVAAGEDGLLRIIVWPDRPPADPLGHGHQVNAVAWSASGGLLATAAHDSIVRVFPSQGGEPKRAMNVGEGAVTDVAFRFDEKTVAAGTSGGAVRVWNVEDGSPRGVLAGHRGQVRAVAAHPKQARLASCGDDGTVRVWDQPIAARVMAGHSQAIRAMALSRDGKTAATAAHDKTVRLWSLDRDRREPEIKRFDLPEMATAVAMSPDAKRFVLGDGSGTLRLMDVARGEIAAVKEAHAGEITALDFHPAQPLLLSTGAGGEARLWDLSAIPPKPRGEPIAACEKRVSAAAFLPDGRGFVTGGEDAKVKLWDFQGKLLRPLEGCWTPIRWVAISPDGQRIAAASDPSTNNKNVYVWNVGDGSKLRDIPAPSGASGLSFTSDGSRLAVGGPDNRIGVYRIDDGLLLEEIVVPARPVELRFLHGDRAIVAATGNTPVLVHHALRFAITGHGVPVTDVAYAADGATLFSSANDKTIRQWDAATGEQVRTLDGCDSEPVCLAVSREGGWVAAGGGKTVRLWKIDANSPARVQPSTTLSQPSDVRDVASSGDGRVVAVGCDDHQVRLWDVSLGCLLESLAGHEGGVLAVALAPDGRTLASGGHDRSVRRWTRSVARAVRAHQGPIRAMAAAPDGSRVLTAGDRHVGAWSVREDKLLPPLEKNLEVTELAIDPQAPVLAGLAGSEVHVWDLAGRRPASTLPSAVPVAAMALADGGKKLLLGGSDGAIRQYALSEQEGKPHWDEVGEIKACPESVAALALGADGRTLISAGAEKAVKRWVAFSLKPRGEIGAHRARLFGVAFSPDSDRLATAGGDGTARIWSVNPGNLLAEIKEHEGQVLDVAFRGDGQRLATCGTDRTVRLYDAAGKPIRTLRDGLLEDVGAVRFAPDGSWMAAAGRAGRWYRWAADRSKPQKTVPGHSAPIGGLAINPAGTKLATLDLSGQLIVWDPDGSPKWHQQLSARSAYGLAWSPDGEHLALATSAPRLMVLLLPERAR